MMGPEILFGIILGFTLLGGGAAVLAGTVMYLRDPGQPATPEWTAPELAALRTAPTGPMWPEPGTQTPCAVCGGRRCKGCEAPARITATWSYYRGVHNAVGQWTRKVGTWWAPPAPPARVRRIQLELARRLRASGVPTVLGGRRIGTVLP